MVEWVTPLLELPRRLSEGDETLGPKERKLAATQIFVRHFIENVEWRRILQRAAGLTYHTALSVVPILVLFLALAGSIGLLEGATEEMLDLIFETWVPVSEPWLRESVESIVAQASSAYLGSVGLLFFLWTAIGLFNETEHLINDIWRVHQRRTLGRRVLIFWTMLTVAPPLLTLSLVVSGRVQFLLQTQMGGLPFVEVAAGWIFPILLTSIGLLVMNQLLPNTRVRWKHAAIGALVTAILLEIGKAGFAFYVAQFASVSWFRIYGAIFLLPVLLLWIYVSWVIIGMGVLLTCSLERWTLLRRKSDPHLHRMRLGVPFLAPIEVALVLARAFQEGQGGLTTGDVALKTHLLEEDVTRVLCRFEEAEFLERGRESTQEDSPWHWRRPPDALPLVDVLKAARVIETADNHPPAELADLIVRFEGAFADRVLGDLLSEDAPPPPQGGESKQ